MRSLSDPLCPRMGEGGGQNKRRGRPRISSVAAGGLRGFYLRNMLACFGITVRVADEDVMYCSIITAMTCSSYCSTRLETWPTSIQRLIRFITKSHRSYTSVVGTSLIVIFIGSFFGSCRYETSVLETKKILRLTFRLQQAWKKDDGFFFKFLLYSVTLK